MGDLVREQAVRDWRPAAGCRDWEPELSFPIGQGAVMERQAGTRAAGSPQRVVEDCLSWARETGQDYGVWGGFDDDERRALRHREARARLPVVSVPTPTRRGWPVTLTRLTVPYRVHADPADVAAAARPQAAAWAVEHALTLPVPDEGDRRGGAGRLLAGRLGPERHWERAMTGRKVALLPHQQSYFCR